MRDEKLNLVPDGSVFTANGYGNVVDLLIGTNTAKYNPTGAVPVGNYLYGTKGLNTELAAIIDVGSIGGTSPTFVFTLQSADDSAFTVNVTTLGATPTVSANGEYVVPFQTSQRFLRLNVNPAGSGATPTATVSARVGDRPYS